MLRLNRIGRIVTAVSALAAVLFIAGCATPLTPTSLDDPDALPEQFGVATVQVISNTLRLSPVLPGWTSVMAVDLDDTEKRYRLEPSGTGLLNSRVFIGALPPGHYALFNLHSYALVGDVSYWLNAPLPRSLGTFFVEENRISSLGTLVYQPLTSLAGLRRGEQNAYLVTRFDDREDFTSFVAEAYPDVFAQLNRDVLLGWEPDPHEALRNETVELISKVPVGLSYHWFNDGRIAMTGPLGQLLWRNPESGQWQQSNTGYNNELAVVTEFNDHYLAAGERGLVLQAESLEGPWKATPGLSTQEAIYWLHHEPGHGVFALARAGNSVRFYSVDSDFSRWEQILEFEYDPGFFFTGAGKVHAVAPGDDSIIIFGDRQRIVYNIESGTMDSESNDNVFRLSQQPDGTLVILPGSLWSGVSSPKISHDLGKKWQRVRRIRDYERWKIETRSMPIVLNETETIAVSHRGYRGEDRRIKYEEAPRIRLVRDNNYEIASWGKPMLSDCTRLLPEVSKPELIFAACLDGSLMRSEDQGETWQLDYESGVDPEDAAEALKNESLI